VTREPILAAVLLAACATSSPGPNATEQARRNATGAPQASQAASANESASVRTDGVYLRRYPNHPATLTYLRFYDDGTVIGVTAMGEPRYLLRWFNRERDSISKGQFRVQGSSIEFTLHPGRQPGANSLPPPFPEEPRSLQNRGVILDGGAALNLSAPGEECRGYTFLEAEILRTTDLQHVLERLDAVHEPRPDACSRPDRPLQKRPSNRGSTAWGQTVRSGAESGGGGGSRTPIELRQQP